MPPSQEAPCRELCAMVLGYAVMKCGLCGRAVGLRARNAQRARNGRKRAQKGAKDPRPVWIGAGAVAVQV